MAGSDDRVAAALEKIARIMERSELRGGKDVVCQCR